MLLAPTPYRASVARSASCQLKTALSIALYMCPPPKMKSFVAPTNVIVCPPRAISAPDDETTRAGAVFDGSEPLASGTRAHDQKVANYEPLVPIYEVVKTALVACPINECNGSLRMQL